MVKAALSRVALFTIKRLIPAVYLAFSGFWSIVAADYPDLQKSQLAVTETTTWPVPLT